MKQKPSARGLRIVTARHGLTASAAKRKRAELGDDPFQLGARPATSHAMLRAAIGVVKARDLFQSVTLLDCYLGKAEKFLHRVYGAQIAPFVKEPTHIVAKPYPGFLSNQQSLAILRAGGPPLNRACRFRPCLIQIAISFLKSKRGARGHLALITIELTNFSGNRLWDVQEQHQESRRSRASPPS